MRRWKPQPSIGRWIGLLLLIIALSGAVYLAWPLLQNFSNPPQDWQINLSVYSRMVAVLVLLFLSGVLAYRFASALTLSYALDRNGMYVNWLGNRAVIPLDSIISVDLGIGKQQLPWNPLQGVGYYWGQYKLDDGKRLHLFATKPVSRCLVIYTPNDAYAISPADHDAFVQDLEQRRNLGATKPLAPTVESSRIFLYAFWNDRTVRQFLLVALLLNLLIMGILAARYPNLAPTVPMRFNAIGQVAEPRPRHQVLFLPLAAFGIGLINTVVGLIVYSRQPLGSRLLQGASVLAQILFGIAVLTIIR